MGAVVRLLSYNVRSLRDDRAALVRVLRACAPDVLCLQEAPRFPGWRLHAARLGRATGLVHVSGGAPSSGTMIMAAPRVRVEYAESSALPRTPGLHRRGLTAAVLDFGARDRLAVVSCHLGLRAEERRRHGVLLPGRLAALGPAAGVLAGDFNERPGGRTFRSLAARLPDAWETAPAGGAYTFPARAPDRRIDAVLCTPAVEVLGCGVPHGLPGVTGADLRTATDHLPVLAELRLPRG